MGSQNIKDLENAAEIIQRFGGIRPMASKMDVPVTTVQGWKKRNTIPENRVEDILKAAREHNIDLSDIQSANENKSEAPAPQKTEKQEKPSKLENSALPPHDSIMAEIRNATQKSIRTSIWVTTLLLLLTTGVAILLFAPKVQQTEENALQIQAMQEDMDGLGEDVRDINQRTSFMRRIVPEDLQARIDDLQSQARNVQENVKQLTEQADEIQQTLFSADAGSLSTRLKTLETQFAEFENAPDMSGFIARVETLEKTVSGQGQLDEAIKELTGMVQGNTENIGTLEDQITQAQEEETALGETMEGVSREEMKAAVMLLAFSQFRDSLNREGPFEEDLAVLQKLAGEDEQLQGTLERLAPHADGGVLSPEGLSEEFKGLAGDIVFSSLKGEEVSLWDRTKARFSNALQVEKDGEVINGTDTQAIVSRAQTLLDEGDVRGAMAELNQLEGDAAQKAQPFMEQAQATALTNDAQAMVQNLILSRLSETFGGVQFQTPQNIDGQNIIDGVTETVTPSQGVVKDEESGFTILPRQQGGFKGLIPNAGQSNQP